MDPDQTGSVCFHEKNLVCSALEQMQQTEKVDNNFQDKGLRVKKEFSLNMSAICIASCNTSLYMRFPTM